MRPGETAWNHETNITCLAIRKTLIVAMLVEATAINIFFSYIFLFDNLAQIWSNELEDRMWANKRNQEAGCVPTGNYRNHYSVGVVKRTMKEDRCQYSAKTSKNGMRRSPSGSKWNRLMSSNEQLISSPKSTEEIIPPRQMPEDF